MPKTQNPKTQKPQTPEPTSTRPSKHTLPAFTPVPRLKQRSNGWKPEVQRAFIEALAETGSVAAACRRVGRSDHGAYLIRRHPEGKSFAKAWEAALALGVQKLEDIAMDRALNGVEVPVYAYGKIIGTRRVYNDRLLMFILRNRAGKRFAAGDGEAGGTGALKIVQQRKMKKLKKLWFEEWEAEQRAKQVSAAEIRASINRKIEDMRREVEADISPRGHELRMQAEAQARADEEAGWSAGKPYEDYADAAAALLPKHLEALRRQWAERNGEEYQALLEDGRSHPTEDDSEEATTRAPSGDRKRGVEAEGADGQRPTASAPRPMAREPSEPGSEAEPAQRGHRSRPALEGKTKEDDEEERLRQTRSEVAAILWARRKQLREAVKAKEEEETGESPSPSS